MTSGTDPGQRSAKTGRWLALVLLLLSAILLLLGMAVGSTGWDSLALLQRDLSAWQIVWEIRLPRSVGAWLAGGLLGLAGALAQGLFRNPLADPYLLGSASGASLGVALPWLCGVCRRWRRNGLRCWGCPVLPLQVLCWRCC
jgi:iron complex transport system permease protein